MLNKLLLVIISLLAIVLIVGCAQKSNNSDIKSTSDSVNTDTDLKETVKKTNDKNTESIPSVSEEDLNKLKEDLDNMHFDDLNELSK